MTSGVEGSAPRAGFPRISRYEVAAILALAAVIVIGDLATSHSWTHWLALPVGAALAAVVRAVVDWWRLRQGPDGGSYIGPV